MVTVKRMILVVYWTVVASARRPNSTKAASADDGAGEQAQPRGHDATAV